MAKMISCRRFRNMLKFAWLWCSELTRAWLAFRDQDIISLLAAYFVLLKSSCWLGSSMAEHNGCRCLVIKLVGKDTTIKVWEFNQEEGWFADIHCPDAQNDQDQAICWSPAGSSFLHINAQGIQVWAMLIA